MELLQLERAPLSLETIFQRTRFSKTSVYRILQTLVHRGYVARSGDGLYRLVSLPLKLRFGFAGQSSELPFSQAVTSSLQLAASASGVDLLVLDNRYDADTALKNAEQFVSSRLDLVIEFQVEQHVAPIIADRIAAAGIPLIAIDIPHPHAVYFGVDNYRVGYDAGLLLGQHAIDNWRGQVDWILGLDIEEAGPLVQSRVTGAFEGVRSMIKDIPVESCVRIDGWGLRERSRRVIFDFLRRHSRDRHILLAAGNDTSALGALEAAQELGREKQVVIVGQDCIPEVVAEMRRPGSSIIGSVSHEVTEYGPRIMEIGVALIRGRHVAPYNYVVHKMVTGKSLLA